MRNVAASGAVALVTGAGSGIGRAIALGIAEGGIRVAAVDIAGPNATATAERAVAKGGAMEAFATDVSRAPDVVGLYDQVRERMGIPSVLINCVGIYPRSRVADMSEEEWDRVLSTNLKSAFLMCRAVVPGMAELGQGRIVSITSSLGVTGSAGGAHYAASKAGLDAFTRSLAHEVGEQGINVNCVAPGLTDTPMMRGANSPEYIALLAARSPGGRLGQPEDVLGLVLFLLSDGAAHITGQVYNLR